jgi:O-antigen ligase
MTTSTFARSSIGRWLASSFNELAVAGWTTASFPIMFVTAARNESMLFIPLALGLPFFLWRTWRKPVTSQVDPVVSVGVFLLFISILGSYLFNSEFYEPVQMAGNIISALVLFSTLYLIVMKLDLDFQKVLVFQSILINAFLPVVLHNSRDVWGRLEPTDLHPNYVSMMAIVAVLGAMSTRSIILFVLLAPVPLYTMVMMQSRASMMATGAAIGIIIGNFLWQNRSKKMLEYFGIAFVFGGVASAAAALAGYSVFDMIASEINKLFMIDNDLRGVSSGASGRSDLWAAAFQLWATHPIFGVGFKGHMQFMPENMPAHNAFLGLLADNGLTGLVGYFLIIGGAAITLLRRGSQGLNMFGQRAAIIFPYFLYGLVETRAFSFGNTYSVLFLLVAFDTAKYRVAPRVPLVRGALPGTTLPDPRAARPEATLTR